MEMEMHLVVLMVSRTRVCMTCFGSENKKIQGGPILQFWS